MFSISKKNKTPQQDGGYNSTDSYAGYDYGTPSFTTPGYDEPTPEDPPIGYTQPDTVDAKPTQDLSKTSIKLMKLESAKDRTKIAECIKDGCAVIFDLSNLDRGDWYRVIDYMQGVIFVIEGSLSRFSEYSLVAAPKNFDISSIELDDDDDEDEEDEEEDDEDEEDEEDEDEE